MSLEKLKMYLRIYNSLRNSIFWGYLQILNSGTLLKIFHPCIEVKMNTVSFTCSGNGIFSAKMATSKFSILQLVCVA